MSVLDVSEYFDGNVKSIGFQTETLRATVGVMAPGEYEFGTSQHETMAVEVDANQKFQLQVGVDTAYLCTYA
jgi:hypothetical protein